LRFGIYETLDEAKFAIDYSCLNSDASNLDSRFDEAYIKAVELGSIPDLGKRQGIKVCFMNESGNWELYKPEKHVSIQ